VAKVNLFVTLFAQEVADVVFIFTWFVIVHHDRIGLMFGVGPGPKFVSKTREYGSYKWLIRMVNK
jgi:hypothetical protein